MKRWEPIKTEKKQLGGIIKLLKKVSPKLASKAKGRLLVSRLRQVKDLKTPYIFPGQLGWSPAETRTVWHRTNNPNFKVPAKGKNKLRNHILREAEQSGADAVKFQGIKDNKASNQNVTFIFDPVASTTIPPKEMRAFKEQITKLTPQ